jgi:hypothetical protein
VDLNPPVSEWIRNHETQLFSARFYAKVAASVWDNKHPTRGLKRICRIPQPWLAQALGCHWVPDLLGSNFSIDRELLYQVNGFDEGREHYWGEDGDLYVRVRNSNAKITGRKSFAVQLHLWHPTRSPQKNAEADYRKQLADFTYVRCPQGLRPIP